MRRVRSSFWRALGFILLTALTSCSGAGATPSEQPSSISDLTVTSISLPEPSATAIAVPAGLRVAFVSSADGTNDRGMNELAVGAIRRIMASHAQNTVFLSSADPADYGVNLTNAAEQAGLVIGLGSDMAGPMAEVARAQAKASFALIDAPEAPPSLSNVRWLAFDMDQAAFLAGVASAGLSRTHSAGFVGSKDLLPQRRLLSAFQAGARSYHPQTAVLSRFAGSEADQTTAKRLAQDLMGKGADALFASTFVNSLGVIAAASQARRFAVGIERDEFMVAPNAVVTSVVKRTDIAAEVAIADYLAGQRTGQQVLGVQDEALGFAPFRTTGPLSVPLREALLNAERQLATGTLSIR